MYKRSLRGDSVMVEISILVPVYNVEKYLESCLDSILDQIFTDFEVICIDDGSTDKSGDILDAYALNDTRIKVIHKVMIQLKEICIRFYIMLLQSII